MVADRLFLSSKLCSSCGAVNAKLRLDERTYSGENCGLVIDRELNAVELRRLRSSSAVRRREWPGDAKRAPKGSPAASADAPVKREEGTGQPDWSLTSRRKARLADRAHRCAWIGVAVGRVPGR